MEEIEREERGDREGGEGRANGTVHELRENLEVFEHSGFFSFRMYVDLSKFPLGKEPSGEPL